MTDIVDCKTRSRMMSGIGSRDTAPELMVRRFLHSNGLRYRLHGADLPGTPDIVLPKYKTVVFVHGCFWHRHRGCKLSYLPKSNRRFWKLKFDANVRRDERKKRELRKLGWRVFVIWSCSITDRAMSKLHRAITSDRKRNQVSIDRKKLLNS